MCQTFTVNALHTFISFNVPRDPDKQELLSVPLFRLDNWCSQRLRNLPRAHKADKGSRQNWNPQLNIVHVATLLNCLCGVMDLPKCSCKCHPTPHIYPHPTGCPDLGPHPSQGRCHDTHSLSTSGLQGVGHSSRGDGPGEGGVEGSFLLSVGIMGRVSVDLGPNTPQRQRNGVLTTRWAGFPPVKGHVGASLAVEFSGLNEVTVLQAEFPSSWVTVEITRLNSQENPGAVDSFCR